MLISGEIMQFRKKKKNLTKIGFFGVFGVFNEKAKKRGGGWPLYVHWNMESAPEDPNGRTKPKRFNIFNISPVLSIFYKSI